jgi:hypothetical protein
LAIIYQWLDNHDGPVASCNCGCTEFYIRLDNFGKEWEKILGTECVSCGEKVDWTEELHEGE